MGISGFFYLKGELQDVRGDIEKNRLDRYSMATTTARKANIEPSMPRVVGRQKHQSTTKMRSQFLCWIMVFLG